jgi:hypothetical protein
MKIIVNPAYEHLRKFVESIPDIFESEGRVIYSGRNLIKVMTVDDGLEINIKRYGVPALVNRIAYSCPERKARLFISQYTASERL